ncbi:myozenin-2-like [Paramormyrops kingsleyae]|uniref:Myozenin 2a n=1 Tax=Paramormyrops kingsleyae TaxID=1676925 RepID=A0A3B3RLB0_9TELE|nr:myozenin-2-like [Paramormyrops kingsleyae]
MSQYTMMSSQQRKAQAAAICREVRGPCEDVMDLGRKVSAPKEIMLEELSLSSNRGSRLFKMRQRRSDRYTFESVQNEAASVTQAGVVTTSKCSETSEAPLTAPDAETSAAQSANIAPGYGAPLKDVPPERFNSTAVPKSYQSPWDQAVLKDPSLADTLSSSYLTPEPQTEVPMYKSFNRVATPFGGFDRAPTVPAFKAPELDLLLENSPHPCPELLNTAAKRPTFNRSALGWVANTSPPTVILQPMTIPESDDL